MKSRNLEVILKKAASDEEFRERLLKERNGALIDHELELDSDEKAIPNSVPEEQLRQMISVTPVSEREMHYLGRRILTAGIVTAIVLGVAVTCAPVVTAMGIRPTEQGYVSATRSRMADLKSALIYYHSDIGYLPIPGQKPYTDEDLAKANELYLGNTFATNVLVNPDIDVSGFFNSGSSVEEAREKYRRRWKGPYMDGSPADFMIGSTGGKILLDRHEYRLILHHPGTDNLLEALGVALGTDYEGDDLTRDLFKMRAPVAETPQSEPSIKESSNSEPDENKAVAPESQD
ncbi:MAG: hypothetical protein KKB51_24715 [Candidatus Riflebacteria bacterium]|nr:hypothetical protein [Candidatus Riflebacteria bacterium]